MELHMSYLVQVVLYMIPPKSNVFGQPITHVLEVEEPQKLHLQQQQQLLLLLQQQQFHLLQEQQQQLHLLQQQQQLHLPLLELRKEWFAIIQIGLIIVQVRTKNWIFLDFFWHIFGHFKSKVRMNSPYA